MTVKGSSDKMHDNERGDSVVKPTMPHHPVNILVHDYHLTHSPKYNKS